MTTSKPLTGDTASLAAEAYVYMYPLVIMEVSRRQQTARGSSGKPGFGASNAFHHMRAFPTADFRAIVRPNFDTLYSSAWLDLTGGAVLIELPDSDGRYYMLPLLDMWTDVFAVPGSRTTGNTGTRIMVIPPGFDGDVPDDALIIEAPTPYVWAIGRSQTNGPSDYDAVGKFQDGFTITPLGGPTRPESSTPIDLDTEPLRIVAELSAPEFFRLAAEVLTTTPPHLTDQSVLARIAAIGIVPGLEFDTSRFDEAGLAALESGIASARKKLPDISGLGDRVNGWQIMSQSVGVYGNDYFQRAQLALIGLGANPPEDAIYPVVVADADGRPLDGHNDYTITFPADGLPPVNAFWSVTMYDAEGYQVANELDRFALGDRDELRFNDDGSLVLYLQHENPGSEKTDNWLPAPQAALGVTMRLYAPRAEVLDGTWAPPAVQRVKRASPDSDA